MASREKKPLAPSKSKQKASSDSGLPSNEVKNKKGKSLPNVKQQQVAQEIFDTVATGSQLSVKLEASLPRRKALKNLKRKQNLRAAKVNLIKSKVTKKVTNKDLYRVACGVIRGVKVKKVKQSEESTVKAVDITLRLAENQTNNGDNEGKGTETPSKSAKNNLRTKKTKSDIQNKEEASSSSSAKVSPKLGRKGKTADSPDSLLKSAKTVKLTNLKKNNIKDNLIKVTESDSKGAKSRKSTAKELDFGSSVKSNSSVEKLPKAALDNKSSIDLTIDEVIACSMLSDTEAEGGTEKTEGKLTRSKKMLVDENTIGDIEIKKEPDTDDMKIPSDGEYTETDQGLHLQKAIQLRKRRRIDYSYDLPQKLPQRRRNGKQRQLSDSGNSADNDVKKRHRLNSEGTLDNSIEHISDCNINTDSCFSDPGCNESQNIVASNKREICLIKNEMPKNFEEDAETGLEVENNNNSDRMDRTAEIGPTLRSKTKAKIAETEATKDDDAKVEDARVTPKPAETQEDSKKLNLDPVRKDNILAKIADKSKGRRSSLNIDTKKTVNSFYNNSDKSDGNSKSQIDQMIESIKLNIAKSIEKKIFGPEKSLGLSKNFDAKIEEIVAPLSTESQKMGLEENTDEDRSTVTKNEITSDHSDNSENSVPKVADTAKEIEEKLVKFDIGEAETHSQSIQENKASNSDRINDVHNTSESTCNLDNSNGTSCNSVDESGVENIGCSTSVTNSDNESKTSDESKKTVPTRKSSRISDKSSDNGSSPEAKKSNRTPNKAVKSDNAEDVVDAQKSTNDETILEDTTSRQISDNAASSSASTSSEQIEEQLLEDCKQAKEMEELDADILNAVSDNLEESETLESISREVERLVAGEQCAKPLATNSSTSLSKEMISDILDKEEQVDEDVNEEDASACCNDNSTPSAANSTNETNNSHVDGKSVEASETLQEDEIPCRSAQSAKHFKPSNNHSPTTVNCDSNSEYSSVNSVPTHTCTSNRQNDEADQDDNCKELNKSSDTSNSDENASDQKPEHSEIVPTTMDQSNKASDDKSIDEQKPVNEENRRVLRARDKQKKAESKQNTPRSRDHADSAKIKTEESSLQKAQSSNLRGDADEASSVDSTIVPESSQKTEDTSDSQHSNELDANELEPQARTRRSREIKKRKEELPQLSGSSKTKRVKRDLRKSDQQNKEETLLDNEVAKINENNRSFLSKYGSAGVERTESFREFFEQQGGQSELDKIEKNSNLRSKSENDIRIVDKKNGKSEERQLLRNLSENHVSKQTTDSMDILESECKTLKTPELAQKDSDEASTSGESSSNSGTPKILETPEDKERKESILRLLGLEPLEEATQRLQNQQKTKREQSSSSGTLKTVIRVSQKDKDKDKKGSRSPLKMVLKQQGRGDGEGDSPEFYTIQKEFGTSGLGDSSSGANRKFTTNHRHSCDDDNEEAAPKDRQSLVIPEKSSSFSIHPGRVCADVCCYCFGKFGSLDTPMHLAQMKSDERRKKILNIERHLNKDSCLCDACYRHVDRKANTSPTNMQQKPQKQHRQLMISKCSARECRDPARHHVKRRWLLKIKTGLQNQVDIDWESTQHTTMSFCVSHYEKIGRFLTCALCKRRLARAHTYQVVSAEIDELNQIIGQQGIPVSLVAGTFVCKLCRYFTQLQLKYKDINMNLNHKSFCKSYRRRILHYLGIEVADDEDDDSPQQASQVKDKKSKKGPKSAQQLKSGSSKSPDRTTSGTSEKSTPEPNKNEGAAGCSSSEIGNETRTIKAGNMSGGENGSTDVHYLGIESAVENLKKRKMLDMYATSSSCDSAIANEMVEILGMDNEITLTRLPKKPKVNSNSNDITPVVQRLGANPSISVRTLFPGEEEMNLHVNIEFQNVREVTPQGWEKCATMIQYDRETKLLWQQLQRPYGNQSSFLRHLILLEKYYRAGDLILAPNASRNAINYSTSVQNRLISYEGPEKMDEPIMEPIAAEYNNSRRLSGGYMLEKERLPTSSMSRPSTSGSGIGAIPSSHSAKVNAQQRVLKLNSGVSIIKKPPPNLQRLNLPSSSGAKRKDGQNLPAAYAGKLFHMNEPEMLRTPKRQKLNDRQSGAGTSNGSIGGTSGGFRSQYQKQTPVAVAGHNQQFHKHLRMQQEMLSRQSRSDFEPLICDITRTTAVNESSTTNLIQNFNLPKSIQVTTKPTSSTSNPIPILPKIPKSLTVIPQTITRPADK